MFGWCGVGLQLVPAGAKTIGLLKLLEGFVESLLDRSQQLSRPSTGITSRRAGCFAVTVGDL